MHNYRAILLLCQILYLSLTYFCYRTIIKSPCITFFKLLSLIIFGLALVAGYYALQLFISQSSLAGYTLAALLIIIGAALLITAHDLFRCRQWKDVGKALGNFAAMVCGYSTK